MHFRKSRPASRGQFLGLWWTYTEWVHRCRILWHGVEICESCYDSESRSKPSSKSVTMSLQTPLAYVTTQLNAEIAFSEKPQSANYVPKYTYLWKFTSQLCVVIEKENYRCTNLIRNFCRERLHWKCFWQISVKICFNSLPHCIEVKCVVAGEWRSGSGLFTDGFHQKKSN